MNLSPMQPSSRSAIHGLSIHWLLVVTWLALIPATGLAQDDGGRGGDRGDRAERGQWDPEAFLRRLDRDGNGYLDQNEMGGRSGRFIQNLGFDPSRPVAVTQVIKKIQSDRNEEARQARRQEIEAGRKVPRFGEEVDLPPVASFGELSSSGAPGSIGDQFDEETRQIVEAYMQRYDENQDGFLAGGETRRVGRLIGGISEADTDKDGRLNAQELAEGYQRQQKQRLSDTGESSSDNRSGRGRPDRSPPSSAGNGFATRPVVVNDRSLDDRVSSYVDGVFKKYDTDGNNSLSEEERAKLRVPFKDTDGDGNISREEAMGYVGGAQQSAGSVSPAASASRNSGAAALAISTTIRVSRRILDRTSAEMFFPRDAPPGRPLDAVLPNKTWSGLAHPVSS